MTRVEKQIRILVKAEQIRQLQGELIALQDEGTNSGGTQLMLAGIHLAKAAEQLERTPTLDLETTLRLSIASVAEKNEAKKRCQQVGGCGCPLRAWPKRTKPRNGASRWVGCWRKNCKCSLRKKIGRCGVRQLGTGGSSADVETKTLNLENRRTGA